MSDRFELPAEVEEFMRLTNEWYDVLESPEQYDAMVNWTRTLGPAEGAVSRAYERLGGRTCSGTPNWYDR